MRENEEGFLESVTDMINALSFNSKFKISHVKKTWLNYTLPFLSTLKSAYTYTHKEKHIL